MASDQSESQARGRLNVEIDATELTLGRFQQLAHALSGLVREVTHELTGAGRDAVRWVVADVRRESPLQLQLAPRPGRPDISPELVATLAGVIADGMAVVEDRPERPPYFNDAALERARDLALPLGEEVRAVRFRSQNGAVSAQTSISKRLVLNVDEIVGPKRERFGTIVGRLEGVITHERRTFYIWETLSNKRVECFFGDEIPLERILAAFERRVAARGLIRTSKTGERLSIEVKSLRVFPDEDELPTLDEVEGILQAS